MVVRLFVVTTSSRKSIDKTIEGAVGTRLGGRFLLYDLRKVRRWKVGFRLRSREIERKPRACRLSGRPLVLYRTEEGSVVAFDDRCPHRHAPLSQGKLVEGTLRCPYTDGLDQAGQCAIPASLAQESIERASAFERVARL